LAKNLTKTFNIQGLESSKSRKVQSAKMLKLPNHHIVSVFATPRFENSTHIIETRKLNKLEILTKNEENERKNNR